MKVRSNSKLGVSVAARRRSSRRYLRSVTLVLALSGLLLMLAFGVGDADSSSNPSAPETLPDGNATVEAADDVSLHESMLRVELHAWPCAPEVCSEKRLYSDGFGAVMNGRSLLTHNHYKVPLANLVNGQTAYHRATVTLSTMDGRILWTDSIKQIAAVAVVGETMVITFYDLAESPLFERLGVAPVQDAADGRSALRPGLRVAQLNWDRRKGYLQYPKVLTVEVTANTAVVTLDSCLEPGASGGAIFVNGVHVANNWSRTYYRDPVTDEITDCYSTAALNPPDLLEAFTR